MSEEKHLVQEFVTVEASNLLNVVQDLKAEGYRLGQICAAKLAEGYQLLYSFDKDHVLKNLKLPVAEVGELPSITLIYWPAFIYENEMQDLFGFKFRNLALDYNGKFFKVSAPTPWKGEEK
ncbi:MAG: NADH-quinone oxidoreductase subunit C [Clostridiales Family XIII bacterium]|jgi:ech hydrogenase subunit D|nr:NADH-quinone oxidoreductase subunit C [Clostridiales Family XIII bacterium]